MRCPFCQHPHSSVLETRMRHERTMLTRRRRCDACAHRWVTIELERDTLARMRLHAQQVAALLATIAAATLTDEATDTEHHES